MLRRKLSSQTLCPNPSSCCSWLLTCVSSYLASCECKSVLRDLRDVFGSEPKDFGDGRCGRRPPELIDAVGHPPVANPTPPAERCGGLDRHAGRDFGRQHRVAIALRLLFEKFPAWHRDHARADALAVENFLG